MTRHPLSLALLAAATLLATGCAPQTTPGPSEVSVVKTTPPASAPTPGHRLDRLDLQATPGAGAFDWGTTPTRVWLPQAVEAVAGMDGTSAASGSVYLKVPAPYTRVAKQVSARQDREKFSDYLEVDVPAADPEKDATPAGKVIQGVRGRTRYTVTVSPDIDDARVSVVMVKWELNVAPTATLHGDAGGGHDD